MKLLVPTLVSLGLALSWLSSAQAGAPGMTAQGTISNINAREMGLEVIVTAAASNPMGCSNTGGVYRLNTNAANYAAIASVLTTAYAMHKSVTLWNNSCDTSDNTPLIIAAFVSG